MAEYFSYISDARRWLNEAAEKLPHPYGETLTMNVGDVQRYMCRREEEGVVSLLILSSAGTGFCAAASYASLFGQRYAWLAGAVLGGAAAFELLRKTAYDLRDVARKEE